MKQSLTILLLAASLQEAFPAVTPLYENFGTVSSAVQIDAEAFANYGFFSVSSTLPFDFQNTRSFTNTGTMTAIPGFRFANASSTPSPLRPSDSPFRPADSFVNTVGATITASDTAGAFFTAGAPGVSSIISPSYLLVSADTIKNYGIMTAGAAGLLQLVGKDVDVSRSGLGIGRLELSPTHFVTDSNYFPDPGIYDNYWATTNDFGMLVSSLIATTRTATNATSPLHAVTNDYFAAFPFYTQVAVSVTNTNAFVSVYTNIGGADPDTGRITNVYRQAVFVAVSDPLFSINVKWAPSTILTNPFRTPIVELAMRDTNVVTGDLEFSTLYLKDLLASWTNYVVLTNLASRANTMRPATYELTRTPPLEFLTGTPGKGNLTNTMFFNPRDTNFVPVVTNFYAAYSARIDSLASQPPAVQGLDITDYPGRVEIEADNLNVSRTRMRGTGLISIKTPNLLSASNVVVDTENVIYDLTVPNGTLALQGVAKERVVRLNGNLSAWSAIWTNFFGVNMTNQVDDGSGNLTNVVTNVVTEIDCHMLILDATGLVSTKPVITHDFITHANDVVLSDPMTVVRNLLIDANTFTLNSRLTFTPGDFGSTNVPRLTSFISKGSLTVPNRAQFGSDTRKGYEVFANRGLIDASGLRFKSTSFENSGIITSRVDGIIIETETGQFQDATTFSAGELNFTGTDLRFTASTNASGGKLTLSATHSLADTGEGANNVFRTRNGFELPTKPALGDLLGTRIETTAPRFARVEHVWAGEDRGASAAGFQDNAAIGHLVLGGDRDVLLAFRGTGKANGMYVDLLELTGPLTNAIAASDLGAALEIDPGLTIYFSNSNVPTETLEQLSGGRLRHVEFAGPSSFVQVPVRSGSGTMEMERVIRRSTTVDSDGDGVPNAYDHYPLDFDAPLTLTGSRANGQTRIALSWEAQPAVQYQIEYTTDLLQPVWQVLSTFANQGTAAQTATVQDQLSGDHVQRYYRLRAGQ